jgi:mannitol-1-phosphate 5-dehydrogenase
MIRNKKRALQFGAGNIGRGFLGQLFNQSGYEIIFVDIDENLVSLLNKKRSYPLRIVGDNPQELLIKNVRAVNIKEEGRVVEEVSNCQIMATAVGPNSLTGIAPLIAQGLVRRREAKIEEPLNIIIAENLVEAAKVFKSYIKEYLLEGYESYLENHLGLVKSVVSRMVPLLTPEMKKKNPLLITVEEYSILPVDKYGFKGKIPKIEGIVPYENLKAYEEQKLFIHNAGHALFAYLGYLKGYKYIHQAVEDSQIYKIVWGALQESGKALNKKHKFTSQEQETHIKDLLKRFANRDLGDTVGRVGRDPLRKLSPQERLIGAAKLSLEYEIKPLNLVKGIAAALRYDNPDDEEAVELSRDLRAKGLDWVLEKVCALGPEDELSKMIKGETDTLAVRSW